VRLPLALTGARSEDALDIVSAVHRADLDAAIAVDALGCGGAERPIPALRVAKRAACSGIEDVRALPALYSNSLPLSERHSKRVSEDSHAACVLVSSHGISPGVCCGLAPRRGGTIHSGFNGFSAKLVPIRSKGGMRCYCALGNLSTELLFGIPTTARDDGQGKPSTLHRVEWKAAYIGCLLRDTEALLPVPPEYSAVPAHGFPQVVTILKVLRRPTRLNG